MWRPVRRLLLAAVAALGIGATISSGAADEISVVATFSILADMVKNVGGDRVAVTTLVGTGADAHVYEPTPADVRALAKADLVVVNGLGFEGWIDRLVRASGYAGPVAVASDGIIPLGAEDDRQLDPHAWQDPANGRIYVANIAQALVAADPAGGSGYLRRGNAYRLELSAVERELRPLLDGIPADRRKAITSHDAFRYFGRAFGIDFRAPLGLSTARMPSAAVVAALVRQMRTEGIRALFVERGGDPRLVRQLAREAGTVIGGSLFSDSLSGAAGPAPTYLDMLRHNVTEVGRTLLSLGPLVGQSPARPE